LAEVHQLNSKDKKDTKEETKEETKDKSEISE
jgi:hypothetical protein